MTPTKRPTGSMRKSGETDGDQRLDGLRILVVEDIGMVASSLATMLEELRCVVVGIASRVEEAERFARQEQIDGVLLDLNLGGTHAFSTVEVLRERDIPFIIMSGYDVGELRPELADEPQMPKPFNRAPLEELMLQVFRGHENRRRRADSGSGRTRGSHETTLKTREELERDVRLGMTRFEQEYMGRGPLDVQAHLINDLLIVRMKCVMTFAERHLVENLPPEKGRDLVKAVRKQTMEGASMQINSMVQLVTGVTVRSFHHDLSTRTGERVVVFSLSERANYR